MTKTKTTTSTPSNPPAFPTSIHYRDQGMGLRDYFAAADLTGILAMCADPDASPGSPNALANRAYKTADAMLAEREKQPTQSTGPAESPAFQ